jgi:hypothetical protein
LLWLFWRWGSHYFPDYLQIGIIQISASQVARITGTSHQHPTLDTSTCPKLRIFPQVKGGVGKEGKREGKEKEGEMGMVVHTYSFSTRKAEAKAEGSLKPKN